MQLVPFCFCSLEEQFVEIMFFFCVFVLLFNEQNAIALRDSRVVSLGQNIKEHTKGSNKGVKTFEYMNVSFVHAESPVWDCNSKTLYWVDALQQEVHSMKLETMEHKMKKIEYGEVNIVMPIANSKRLLVAVRAQLFLLDMHKDGDSALRLVTSLDEGKPNNVLNEGKADARGRFWGGTKGPHTKDSVKPDQGSLYCVEKPFHNKRVALRPVTISNGITWSLNSSVLYYIDSVTKMIEAFDFDLDAGEISNRRVIVNITEYGASSPAIPDGMAIDRDGMLWVALMFEGAIIRVNPDLKTIVEAYRLPVTLTTSLTWGGDNLEDLIVTTSRRNLDPKKINEEPLAGSIFILHGLGTGGVPDNLFVFDNADNY